MRSSKSVAMTIVAVFVVTGGFALVARSAAPMPMGDLVIGMDAGKAPQQAEGRPNEGRLAPGVVHDDGRRATFSKSVRGAVRNGSHPGAQSTARSLQESSTEGLDAIGAAARAVPNDLCVDAEPLAVGNEVNGTTLGATVDVAEPCGGVLTAPGVWFSVIGTGNTLTAQLCDGSTSWDSRISVYCGDCIDPICVTGDDDGCGVAFGPSKVSWCSARGTEYFVLVHGYQTAVGDFLLTVQDDGFSCDDPLNCDRACGPTANGLTCEQVTCPTAADACVSTVVSSLERWQVVDCACLPDGACHVVMTPDVFPGVSCAGTCSIGNQCNLIGSDTDGDNNDDLFDCRCGPISCGQSEFPVCDGACPADTACRAETIGGICNCAPVACNQSDPATCGGACPVGETCVSVPGAASCRCAPIGEACSQCGPGPHFIDACGPFPPVGTDLVARSGAVVGIDLNLDCIRDTNLVLRPCPPPHNLLHVDKTLGPIDDSVNFPGTSPVDGHPTGPGLDVIDTEIVSMCLTNGFVTLVAGAGGPSALPLAPTLGTVVEDLGDPAQANSIFDVFFEVSGVPGGPLYNQFPLQVHSRINCLPPAANYLHPTDICIPLTTRGACEDTGNACVNDENCPDSSCIGTSVVVNLVSANHSINEPLCGDGAFPECLGNCPPDQECKTDAASETCRCQPIPCEESQFPVCGGQCPPDMHCQPVATLDKCVCTPIRCEESNFPACGGECPPDTVCQPDDVNGICRCAPVACDQSAFPACGGDCPVDEECLPDTVGGECHCRPVSCNQSDPATCGGACPVGETCVSVPGAAACRCRPIGEACSQCGPGPHFIDACGPFPPVGTDLVARTGAIVGIDLNFDCIQDTNLVLRPCPAPDNLLHVYKTRGPIDDSVNFPGTSPVDGHPTGPDLDVIDTEIVSMCLTNGFVTLVAGAGGPSALPLAPTLGTVVEDLGDPAQANSFFDVFFEVTGVPGGPLYNQFPLQVHSRINCLPPAANYAHPVGICIPLTTRGACNDTGNPCVSNENCPDSSCDGTTVVANLVSANHSVNEPLCGDGAFPECLGNCPEGMFCVTDDANGVCRCEPIPCGESEFPVCDGWCPSGMECAGDTAGGLCACRPVDCKPTADGTACEDAACSAVDDTCAPRCMKFDPQTGETSITDCTCRNPDSCHVVPSVPNPTGNPCVVPDNGTGTVTLPPAGCAYLSPDEVHEIIDGLPPGTTIELAPVHKDFICNESPSGSCSMALAPGSCEARGGGLGGHGDCFDSVLELAVNGTGALAGFTRTLSVPVSCEVHTGPRNPGDAVQTFPSEMVKLEGQLSGDPDFLAIKVTGGTDFGLPSPGHTTLTRLPSGDFHVDSFFDITYQIEFIGSPGSSLGGLTGTTTATIRMQTGSGVRPPSCAATCPAGEICERTTTSNADGKVEICCDCVPEPPSCGPTADRLSCENVLCPVDADACVPTVIRRPVREPFFPSAGTDDFTGTTGEIQITNPSGGVETFIIKPAEFNETRVVRQDPIPIGGIRIVETEIVALSLVAENAGGQQLLVALDPGRPSVGQIVGSTDTGTDYPAKVFFDVFVDIEIPDLPGAAGLSHTEPIILVAPSIADVPPLGNRLTTPDGWNGVALVDVEGNDTGYRIIFVTHELPPPPAWEVVECGCLPDGACYVAFDPGATPPVWCEGSCPTGFVCELIGTDHDGDQVDDTFECQCTRIPCEQSDPAVCGGVCPTGEVCDSVAGVAACQCVPIDCPAGEVTFIFPPDGFTDPAQPHPIHDPGFHQGVRRFLVEAPLNADVLHCWSLCETDAGGTNFIVNIQSAVASGQYVITLDHPLHSGAITTLTYKGATIGTGTGVFKALPGDAGADGKTESGDLKALIDCLNSGTCRLWECDIDRQGRCTGADLEREIDLLNGGGDYDSWDQVMLADDCNCPAGCPRTR